jgi:SAM-dependent methyltransferase
MLRRRRAPEPERAPPSPAVDSYDEISHPGAAFPQTHPDRLATLARLFGGRPGPVERCRVLELGCGDGGNLVPMAYALPDSELVGLDLNAAAAARASRRSGCRRTTGRDRRAGVQLGCLEQRRQGGELRCSVVFDARNGAPLGTIPMGPAPHHLLASQDGTRIYVGEFGRNTVGVVDTASDTAIAHYVASPLANARTHAVSVTRDGEDLYTTNTRAIRTDPGAVIADHPYPSPPGGNRPHGVYYTPRVTG